MSKQYFSSTNNHNHHHDDHYDNDYDLNDTSPAKESGEFRGQREPQHGSAEPGGVGGPVPRGRQGPMCGRIHIHL